MTLTERRERHAAMMQVLRRNDIATWTRRFLDALERSQTSDSGIRMGKTA
jgi:trehalose-6-phosphate synthase